MPVDIIEVIKRSTQGATEPFICRGEDGHVYFVKGKSAGRPSLIKEWVCGRLAELLALPIAPFKIVTVPPELVALPSTLSLHALGAGLAFGSQERQLVSDILFGQSKMVPLETRRDILMFDKWVRNYDRTLSAHGGNPNLLWALDGEAVVMIDHNNAFDVEQDAPGLAQHHIFGAELFEILGDADLRSMYSARFDIALERWAEIVASVPNEWHFADADQSVPTSFTLDQAFAVLCEHRQERFWAW